MPKKTKTKIKTEKPTGASLVIVESPTKEKTLSRFLGKGYVVKSSYGHLRDLPKKSFGLDVKNHFEPMYEILTRGKKILPELKKLAAAAPMIYLATDYDREGESIAWHLSELLNAPEDRVQRITFHEITPDAIKDAIKSPRKIDRHLVDAQVARRALDRIVGYRLSPLLWEKIKRGLSAGRVQSVAVKLICEREAEIEKFNKQEYWSLTVELEKNKGKHAPFMAHVIEWEGKKIEKLDISDEKTAKEISADLDSAAYAVRSVLPKERRRQPAPPFMTSTLAQDSSHKLGYSAKKTMSVAQTLYEGVEIDGNTVGLITYMRTDSLNIAAVAQKEALEYIEANYGKENLPPKPRIYKTKSKGAQEAHEAIRPTSVLRTPKSLKESLSPEQYRLYDLIWKRFVASQMAEAVYDTVTVEIDAKAARSGVLRATGSRVKNPGFLSVYGVDDDEEASADGKKEAKIPPLAAGEDLKKVQVVPEQHFTEPPPRFNEASLIKILEQYGIGRPSTYAPIVDTILSRGYVRLQERKFFPTELGQIVNKQLTQHFPDIVDTGFTAKIEEKLDEVAEGAHRWNQVVEEFYGPFEKDLKQAEAKMEKVNIQPKDSGEICPSDQGRMLIRESRFGKYLCCENFPKCNYKISLDLDGKKILPQVTDEKCHKCGSPMAVKIGRRGKFLACTAYPKCRNIIGLDKDGNKVIRPEPQMTDKKCHKCGSAMLLRVGKRGPFLACSAFPKCRNIQKAEAKAA